MKRLFAAMLALMLVLSSLCAGAEETETQDAPLVLEAGGNYYFQATECVAKLPTVENCRVLQGGGTDGKYIYIAMADNVSKAIIYKYDMETWECVASSEPLKLGHANDITYDPDENLLIIPHTSNGKLHQVDPETLTIVGSETLPVNISRLQYIPEMNQMLVGSSYMLIFYEKGNYDKPVSNFMCQGDRLTTQGLTCDGSYVYDVRWDREQYKASLNDDSILCNWIVVHSVTGEFIGEFPVYDLEGEPENISWLGGNRFAIGCNDSDSIILAELRAEE